MKSLNLNGGWKLHEEPLSCDAGQLGKVLAETDGWLECSLPCDVHMPLQEAGIIRDPVLADYCFESEWVERRSWWFVRKFDSADLDPDCGIVELTIESIDASSELFLNGNYIGSHDSVHYPFVRDVKKYLVDGENTLAVRVTSGLEKVTDADLAELNWAVCHESSNGCPERGDRRRAFVRRPMYTVGWDWGPKVTTIGIVKHAYLRCLSQAVIRGVQMRTLSIDGPARIAVMLETELLDIIGSADADFTILLKKDGTVKAQKELKDVLLTSGRNFTDAVLELPDPELWWPAGSGAQPLYQVEISVQCRGAVHEWPEFSFGVRTLSLDTSRLDEKGRRFQFVVNGVPIYCKGGDWIPADSMYARVTDEKYTRLIAEAREANFNMLRIWGGGIYESDAFYQACDREGILLWHDFMFCCSTYPDHQEWFRQVAAKELDYQTKRLRNHPSLALWSGTNENHWLFNETDNPQWNISIEHEKQYGLYVPNVLAVQAVRDNCPHIPYWNSSPYGGSLPNSMDVGDIHHWQECTMSKKIEDRIEPFRYDAVTAKFVSEYGYFGPCCRESMEQYYDGRPVKMFDRIWNLHDNTFEKGDTVIEGVKKEYGKDLFQMGLDDYILYAGLAHSEMLQYSLEAFRYKEYCSGGLFWMYNDTWGETGWTIIDYYLRRKISYYGVKRAFEPVRLILRREGGTVRAVGCNDTDKDITFQAKAGYLSLDGRIDKTVPITIMLKKASRAAVYECPLPKEDLQNGLFVMIPESGEAAPVYLRIGETRLLNLQGGAPRILETRKSGHNLEVTLTSDHFLYAVHLLSGENCSDNYFPMFPGQVKTVTIPGGANRSPEFDSVV